MQNAAEHTGLSRTLNKTSVLSVLGIGFLSSWVYGAFNTSLLFYPRIGNSSLADPSWFVAISGAIGTLVAGTLLFNRLRKGQTLKYIAAILLACGTPLSALTEVPAVSLVGGLISGIGDGLLWLIWGAYLAEADPESVEFIIPASSGVTVAAFLLYPLMVGISGVIAVSLLPVLSLVCLLFVQNEQLKDDDASNGLMVEEDAPRQPVPTRDVLYAIAYVVGTYFVIGCLDSSLEPSEISIGPFTINMAVVLGACSGILLAVLCIFHSVRIDLPSLSKVIAPSLVGAIVLFAVDRGLSEQISAILYVGADFMAQAVIIVYFVGLEKAGRLRGMSALGISQGMILVGAAAGNLFSAALFSGFERSSSQLLVIVLVLTSVLVLSLSFVPRGVPTVSPSTKPPASDQREHDLAARIREIAVSKGLTARETEILGYLARGRTEPYIREQLWLSRSTVSTHVKHIYQKLGIHSKQEVISLIESNRSE